MPQTGLVSSRAVVDRRFAILPPDGIPESVLPGWEKTTARILAAPAMGASFAQYRLDLAAGGAGDQQLAPDVESFLYLTSGAAELRGAKWSRRYVEARVRASSGLTEPLVQISTMSFS